MHAPREAAAFNANKLSTENMSWRYVFQLGFAALAFAIVYLADTQKGGE
jgi:hypothetical protein